MLERVNLRNLKNIDMAEVKTKAQTLGKEALNQLKYVGTRRVVLAGRSVNPVILGAAALAIAGGVYLLMRRRSRRMQFAGDTTLQRQMQPAK